MSCRDCVFKGIFQDMGASCDVCKFQNNFADAVKACENSANCHHRFAVTEAKKIVIEREGELPTIPQRKTEPSEESNLQKIISDGLKEAAESACKAINSFREALKNLSTVTEGIDDNVCVFCGEIIPEGRQCCLKCEIEKSIKKGIQK